VSVSTYASCSQHVNCIVCALLVSTHFRIADLPLQLAPIPAKPVLLDGAYDIIMEFPDLSSRASTKADATTRRSSLVDIVKWAFGSSSKS
jgi:hypothetical protein